MKKNNQFLTISAVLRLKIKISFKNDIDIINRFSYLNLISLGDFLTKSPTYS